MVEQIVNSGQWMISSDSIRIRYGGVDRVDRGQWISSDSEQSGVQWMDGEKSGLRNGSGWSTVVWGGASKAQQGSGLSRMDTVITLLGLSQLGNLEEDQRQIYGWE